MVWLFGDSEGTQSKEFSQVLADIFLDTDSQEKTKQNAIFI